MATMTPSAIAAELQRKKNLGLKPTDSSNQAAYDKLTVTTPTTSSEITSQPTSTSAVSTAYRNTVTPNIDMSQYTSRPYTSYKPFEYSQAEMENDPAYQAAMRNAEAAIKSSQNNTIARLVANGQGHSTYTDTATQQIANQGIQNVANTLLPQLIQQAYQRHLDSFNANNQVEGQNQNNAFQVADRTGSYVSPEAQSIIGKILQEKQNYGSATDVTGRQQANANANALRDALASMGYGNVNDLLGSGQTLSQATQNQGRVGIQTLAGQGQAFDQSLATRQADLTETQVMAQLTGKMPDGTPTNAYQQQQLANLWQVADATGTIPDTLADLYKLPRGTQTFAAKQAAIQNAQNQQQIGISGMNAATSRMSADWAKDPNNPDNLYKTAQIDQLKDKKPNVTTIDPKPSINNAQYYRSQIDGSKNITKDQALSYVQNNSGNMTDTDYRSLVNWINDNY